VRRSRFTRFSIELYFSESSQKSSVPCRKRITTASWRLSKAPQLYTVEREASPPDTHKALCPIRLVRSSPGAVVSR